MLDLFENSENKVLNYFNVQNLSFDHPLTSSEIEEFKTIIFSINDLTQIYFKGTIDFKKGSKKAKGNENEYCMLLSDKAKSIALPMLLCTEEDVEGNHSTASGKVDEKQLFYIMTRGISYKEAVKLIVKSKFNKIIERISDEDLKEEVLSEIDKRLD